MTRLQNKRFINVASLIVRYLKSLTLRLYPGAEQDVKLSEASV